MASPATRNIGRLSEIAQVAVKHGFGYFFERHRLTDLFPWVSRDGSADTQSDRGRRLREMLDELGPTFVKFGQLLSTRPDIVPPDIVVELQKLQDDVRPIPFADVERVVDEELGVTIEQAFLEFDERPTAAASIGQVHRALLPNGERVAVKVQRPNAPRQIESDIALLFQAARLAKERVRALDFIDAEQVVDEFARSIRSELDYRAEARNAEIFRRNFAGQPDVKIPRVYWTYTRRRVLVLELLEGSAARRLRRFAALTQAERRDLAYRIAETWMTMIFRHGFFHADPHPANIFVLDGGTVVGLVDFGQVGKLTDDDMSRLTGLFIDAANERVDALPRRLAELGVRFPRDREERVRRRASRRLLPLLRRQPRRDRPAPGDPRGFRGHLPDEPAAADALRPARQGDRDARVGRDRALSRLQRLRGCEAVRPEPDDRALLARSGCWRERGRSRPELARIAAMLPHQLHDVLEELRDGQIDVGFVHKGLDEFMHKVDVAFNRLVVALIVVGGLIGSSLIGIFAKHGPFVFGVNFLSFIGFLLSGALGVWLLWGVIRSGRL